MAKAPPAPLSASLLGVPKGAAAPASEPVPPIDAPGPERTGRSSRQPEPEAPDEPRSALTVRLPLTTQERLREAAHRTRREKQAIVDEALGAWLDAHGF